MKRARLLLLLTLWLPITAGANDAGLKLRQLSERVYAIVGELGNRSPQNFGNNATFGFVVTDAGVVLVDPGGSYRGAQAIHATIQQVTSQPVVKVINTGGQDHRWLGNGYFRERGAEIIASESALKDQRARVRDQLIMLTSLVGENGLAGTDPVYADRSFGEALDFDLGGVAFQLRHAGQAHTPGDSYVWLPRQKIMFSGDIVYVERMLNVSAQSNSKSWIDAFGAMAAHRAQQLVPGHGSATSMTKAREDTLAYLRFLRKAVADFMDDGGDISDIGSIDQSAYDYLLNHETLAGRNAQQVFIEMEWE